MSQSNGSGSGKRGERRDAAESEADRWSRETGYRPSGNQLREEPVPASRHEERDQEAVIRNEEHAADDLDAGPSRRAKSD